MKPKMIVKLCADILMTVALLFLMGYQFWGEAAHEWIGAGMFVLFILHHILNLNWHKRIFKGKYTAMRTVTLCVDILVLLAMLALMYSGIVMSRHVFAFLPIESGLALARKLHILGAYWGFILMSLHLGLHWNMILGMLRKQIKLPASRARNTALFLASAVIAAYGVYVFISRNFATYLFLQSEFVFLDYNEPKCLFYIDYLALMGLCIFIAHYASKLCRRKRRSENEENPVNDTNERTAARYTYRLRQTGDIRRRALRTVCFEETRQESTAAPSDSESVSPDESETTEPSSESAEKKLKMTVNGQEVLITLYDTPTANALYAALPMELNFSDYNGTEKIAYPPEALPTEGEPDGCDPDVGDLCLYAPWGNLCIFYQDFRYSQSLIKLGHIESGMELLTGTSGDYAVTLERMD